jgi:hypothetical protein
MCHMLNKLSGNYNTMILAQFRYESSKPAKSFRDSLPVGPAKDIKKKKKTHFSFYQHSPTVTITYYVFEECAHSLAISVRLSLMVTDTVSSSAVYLPLSLLTPYQIAFTHSLFYCQCIYFTSFMTFS